MIRQTCSAALLLLCSLLLASCSGVKGGGCSANCGGNDATVSMVLTATPPAPSSQLSIQAFTATITGLTLTPSGGSAFNVPLNSTTYVAEFTRATSDSVVLVANVSVPPGTYTQAKITFSAPRVTFCTQANPGVPGCTAGTLTAISGAAGSATISTSVTLTASEQTGFVLNANLGAALTVTGQTVTAADLTAANVFTLKTLPPASSSTDLSSGQLAHVDDVMGLVTAISGSNLTIKTASRGSITAVANSSTQYDATNCASPSFSCVQANVVAVVDTILNADGSFTLTYYDPIGSSSLDVIEGVVTGVPDSIANQFTIVVTDSVFASSGSVLNGQLHLGDQIRVSLVTPNPFRIISKGLQIPNDAGGFEGSTSAASILPGQTVAFSPGSFSAQSGATLGTATAQNLSLRFTRITATAAAVSSSIFGATAFPPYFGLALAQQFQTTNGRLSLDGVSSLNNLSSGNTFSATALYLGSPASPQFSAQAVRAH
jgi:hypothetical protein